jgi:hypothetical protein
MLIRIASQHTLGSTTGTKKNGPDYLTFQILQLSRPVEMLRSVEKSSSFFTDRLMRGVRETEVFNFGVSKRKRAQLMCLNRQEISEVCQVKYFFLIFNEILIVFERML